ncbi:MAG: DUF6261 family protein [Dysgonamonadaceae bacterium]|jgi:hypothetical protein|nr:DUF6261 family protein [Dysgonamonadaceae bacterium]
MEKFKAIIFRSLPIAAHYEYCSQVNSEIDDSPEAVLEALGILPTDFKFWLGKERELLLWVKKSVLTEQIAEADKRMDVALSSIRSQVKALENYTNSSVAQAARRIYIMLEGYGEVNKKPYDEQLGDVRSILGQLTGSGPYTSDVTWLVMAASGINTMISELKNAFDAMEQLLAQREERNLKKPDKTFREVRKAIEPIYHSITSIIDANSVVGTSPAFDAFINHMNPKIERINAEFHKAKHDISTCQPEPIAPQDYTGLPITFSPKVLYVTPQGTIRLELGKDFNVVFTDNVEVGNATLTITGKGRYKGHKKVTFIIRRV